MSLSRLHTWSSGEVLTASDLNAEFNNIIDNLSFALSGSIVAGTATTPGLGFIGDTDTGIFSPNANRIGFAAGGVQVFEGSAYASGVNFVLVAPGQAGQPALLTATGSDTNVSLTLRGKGTGYVRASNFVFENFAATQSPTITGRAYWQSTEGGLHISSGSLIGRVPVITGLQRGDIIVGSNTAGVSGATTFARMGMAEQGAFNVRVFGATGDGVTDDTAALQAAITAAAVSGGVVWLPPGVYVITKLNLTAASNITVAGAGWNASRLMPSGSYNATTGHLFDCTGALNITFKNFQVGAFNQTPTPCTAFFVAQTAAGTSNAFHFEGLYVTGKYTSAALYVCDVPSTSMVNCDWYNYTTGAGTHVAAVFSGTNLLSLTSSFATVDATVSSTSDWTMVGCEFHKFAGAGATGSVVALDTCQDLRFLGGNITGGATTYVTVTGTVSNLILNGTTLETESEPVTPTYGVSVAAAQTLTGLSVDGVTYVVGTGFLNHAGTVTPQRPYTRAVMPFLGASPTGTLAAASTNYMIPAGSNTGELALQRMPYKCTVRNLYVAVTGAPVGAETFIYMLRKNNADTAVTVTITGAAITGADTTNHADYEAGDTWTVRVVTSAGAAAVIHGGQFEIEARA